MARTSAPELNEVVKQIESGEHAPTGRTRRTEPPPLQNLPPSSRRTLPKEAFMETRCHWPCPCGGTVPDAPDYCDWRKFSPKANTFCTDACICSTMCGDKVTCEAFKRYKAIVRQRAEEDRKTFERKQSNRVD